MQPQILDGCAVPQWRREIQYCFLRHNVAFDQTEGRQVNGLVEKGGQSATAESDTRQSQFLYMGAPLDCTQLGKNASNFPFAFLIAAISLIVVVVFQLYGLEDLTRRNLLKQRVQIRGSCRISFRGSNQLHGHTLDERVLVEILGQRGEIRPIFVPQIYGNEGT